jgi:hypothetical protein
MTKCLRQFCVQLGNFATETLQLLRETLREHSLSRTAVYECDSRFKGSLESVEDERSGGTNRDQRGESLETYIDEALL